MSQMTLEASLSPAQLAEAFDAFERASAVMTAQYEALQRRVAELDLELEEKNKELRRSLEERENFGRYLESLLDSLTDGVVALTPEGDVSTVNRAAESMFGVERSRAVGAPVARAISPLTTCRVVQSGVDGGFDDGQIETLEYKNESGDEKVFELQFTRASLHPGQKPDGLIIVRDVTELRRLERAANLRNRLTAMGEMAMNVAHEVRNPLGSIELFASALRQDLGEDPERRRLIDFISQGVRSIDNIVSNILMFARPIGPLLESVDPRALLDDVLVYARFHMEQKEIQLSRGDLANGARCLGDVELLKQLFLNLLLNATQAMSTGGQLRLETRATARHVVFIVADNGPGIPAENLSRIFDPFFTTRRRGTGLGLTICHNIIQAHEGTIEVESEPGEGTRFTIRIPKV